MPPAPGYTSDAIALLVHCHVTACAIAQHNLVPAVQKTVHAGDCACAGFVASDHCLTNAMAHWLAGSVKTRHSDIPAAQSIAHVWDLSSRNCFCTTAHTSWLAASAITKHNHTPALWKAHRFWSHLACRCTDCHAGHMYSLLLHRLQPWS